jgi:hypothetical protein
LDIKDEFFMPALTDIVNYSYSGWLKKKKKKEKEGMNLTDLLKFDLLYKFPYFGRRKCRCICEQVEIIVL